MIEYIFLGLVFVTGLIGWVIGYAMGFKDYTEHEEFIEGKEK